MPIDEMKRRVADGIRRRRALGHLRPEGLKPIRMAPGTIVEGRFVPGPALTKQQRRVLIQAAELAIYSLANQERQDYIDAAIAINAVRRQAGMRTAFMQDFLKGVAEQAAELRGEPFELVDAIARTWLDQHYRPSGKTISIPKGDRNGSSKAPGESDAAHRAGKKP
jgi:hypothetical protein